jgi:hypothetical protein
VPFNSIWPKTAVSRAYPIPVLYIQGQGDRWGSVADVTEMAAATVNAHGPLLVETSIVTAATSTPSITPKSSPPSLRSIYRSKPVYREDAKSAKFKL